MDKWCKGALEKIKEERRFPANTTPASRHTEMIGEHLAKKKPYPMLTEEPEHCAGSILATVAGLYEARNEAERLRNALEVLYSRALNGPINPSCGAMLHAKALLGAKREIDR